MITADGGGSNGVCLTLAPGDAVTGQAVWPHVVEEIEEAGRTRDEIARWTALFVADEALVKELRARRDDLSSKLSDTANPAKLTDNLRLARPPLPPGQLI